MALLKADNLTKSFGSIKAVNDISFEIGEGRCVALLGPNGAGKTTTLKMLSGLINPTSGKILFQGAEGKDLRQYIGYLPQYPAFYNWMSGKEFLVFVGQLAKLNRNEAEKRSDELLERVGLASAKKRRMGGYSGGMRQRLGIAQALIHKPKLLMLDEPVSALDPLGRREVLDMMKDLKEETTILFSTHVLHDAQEISDDLLIMHSGQIAVSGEMTAVMQEHEQPILRVELESAMDEWLKQLSQQPYVLEVSATGNVATIYVNNMSDAKKEILKGIVEQSVPVRKFEVAQTTLEDLFMKVVKG